MVSENSARGARVEGTIHSPRGHNFKVVLLGDSSVGKTSIALRLTEDSFSTGTKATLGVDFFVKDLTLPGDVRVALQIWDVGGAALEAKMLKNYVFGSAAILLVYDVTCLQSFSNLAKWLEVASAVFAEGSRPYVAVMANKADMKGEREVRPDQHNAFVKENELLSYNVSAKTGDRLLATFYRIAADLSGVRLQNDDLRAMSSVAKVAVGGAGDTPNTAAQAEELGNDRGDQQAAGTANHPPVGMDGGEDRRSAWWRAVSNFVEGSCCGRHPGSGIDARSCGTHARGSVLGNRLRMAAFSTGGARRLLGICRCCGRGGAGGDLGRSEKACAGGGEGSDSIHAEQAIAS